MAMWSSCFFALAFIVSRGEGLLLRDQTATATLDLEGSGDWAAYAQAETEDHNFLLSQLDDTESELVKLQQFVEVAGRSSNVLAGLQLSATPTAKSGAVPTAKAPVAKKDAAPVAKKETAAGKPTPSVEMDPAKLVASLGIPSLKLKGKAALAPMLAMLKGLYDDSKSRIAQQNTREEKSKKWFAAEEAKHKAKMEAIEGKFKNNTYRTRSDEFRTNETRDENRYFGYWSRVRERQHRQFHTNLKIQHAMMTKVKKMIDMYERTLSGKAGDQEKAQKQLAAVSGGMPEIVFLQEVEHTVGRFCRESLAEVRKERAELQQQAREAME